MQTNRYIHLLFKSFQRNNESLFFIIVVAVLFYAAGFYWGKFISATDLSSFLRHLIFFTVCFSLLLGDYMLKLMWKHNFIFPPIIKCLPNGNKHYMQCYLLKEITSLWNIYLPLFFFYSIFFVIAPLHGFAVAVMLYAGIFLLTLLNSNIVFYLNSGKNKFLYSIFFCLLLPSIALLFYVSFITSWKWFFGGVLVILACIDGYFVIENTKLMKYMDEGNDKVRFIIFQNKFSFRKHNPLLLYISLHIRMILRSPMLRYQIIILTILTLFYLNGIITKESLVENFTSRLFLVSMILLFYPLGFTTFYSTEGAFFDRLVISPSFPVFLKSRYMANTLYSSIMIVVMLLLLKNNREQYYSLIAIFLYCVGFFMPLCFLSIFFANHKTDISTYSKVLGSKRGAESLFQLIIFILLFGIVLLINHLFSEKAANHFMFFTGLIFGLFVPRWLSIIHEIYMKHTKYTHLENYRK